MPLRSLTMQCLDGARPFFAFTRRYQQYRTMPKHSTAYPMLHVQSITDTSRSLHCPCFASPNHSPQLLDCSEHINAYTGHCGTLPMRDPTIPCRNIEGRCITEPKPDFSVLCLCLALLCLAGTVKCFTLHSQYWTLPDPNGA